MIDCFIMSHADFCGWSTTPAWLSKSTCSCSARSRSSREKKRCCEPDQLESFPSSSLQQKPKGRLKCNTVVLLSSSSNVPVCRLAFEFVCASPTPLEVVPATRTKLLPSSSTGRMWKKMSISPSKNTNLNTRFGVWLLGQFCGATLSRRPNDTGSHKAMRTWISIG